MPSISRSARVKCERPALLALMGEHGRVVVLQIAPTPGSAATGLIPTSASCVRVADAGEHQQLRRVDRAAAEHDLALRPHLAALPACTYSTPTARPFSISEPRHMRPRAHREVSPPQRRTQIDGRRAAAAAVADRPLRPAEAVLLGAVVVVGEGMARALAGGHIGLVERIDRLGPAHIERAAAAAQLGLAILPGLRALEIGQHVAERPAGSP